MVWAGDTKLVKRIRFHWVSAGGEEGFITHGMERKFLWVESTESWIWGENTSKSFLTP